MYSTLGAPVRNWLVLIPLCLALWNRTTGVVLTEIQFFAALMAAYYEKWEKGIYAVPFIDYHQTTISCTISWNLSQWPTVLVTRTLSNKLVKLPGETQNPEAPRTKYLSHKLHGYLPP